MRVAPASGQGTLDREVLGEDLPLRRTSRAVHPTNPTNPTNPTPHEPNQLGYPTLPPARPAIVVVVVMSSCRRGVVVSSWCRRRHSYVITYIYIYIIVR